MVVVTLVPNKLVAVRPVEEEYEIVPLVAETALEVRLVAKKLVAVALVFTRLVAVRLVADKVVTVALVPVALVKTKPFILEEEAVRVPNKEIEVAEALTKLRLPARLRIPKVALAA